MLRSLLAPKVEVREQATVWGTWPGDNATTGVTVTQMSALQLLAVSGCVRLITDSIATLPVDAYRENQQTGVRTEMTKPYWLKNPTLDLDFTAWCTQVLTSLLLHGNAYLLVTRNASNAIIEVYPMDPCDVNVRRIKGKKAFFINGVPFPGEIVHIPGMMLPGSDTGLSPLEYARQSISGGLSAQAFAQDNFDQGLNMPGVIESPGQMQPDQMTAIAQAWKRARSKRNRGLPGVLQNGATWKPTGVTSEQAQFLQTRQWTAAEIAGQVYMVDPSDLGIPVVGTSLTYGNLEQRNIRRLQVTLLPWIVRVEKALSGLLPEPQFVKFNVDGLLRADSASRWTTYKIATEIDAIAATLGMPPVLTTVEMRDFEDLGVVEEYPAPEVAPAPQMNSATPDMHFHLPESIDVQLRQEPVIVPAPVVNVPAPIVNITQPEPRVVSKRAERDENGRITRVIEETV